MGDLVAEKYLLVPDCDDDRLHRICVWGGDDFVLVKPSMTEAKARAMWSRLRDFITRKTLEQRLGFVFW